jgi:HemY protein
VKSGLILIIVLALGALAANYLLQDNGYVLINFRGYVIEMSVPVLAFLLVVAYLAIRLLIRIWRAPRQLGEAAARRRVRKAGERITQGYIEIGQGNFARGEKLLTKGARNSETPLLNYLAAARAAQAQGDIERRDNWLAMASEQEPRAQETVLLTKAQLQLEAGDRDAASRTLDAVLGLSARNPEALRLKAEIDVARQDWAALENTLPLLRKLDKMSMTTLDHWTVQCWSALLRNAGGDKARGKALWKSTPRHLRDAPELVAARAMAFAAAGDAGQAESVLRAALKQAWHESLIVAYGQLEAPAATERLKRVENWLRERPEDPVLLRVAARLCVATELWGKARSYYESSAAIRPAPETWHELGQLLQKLGDKEGAFSAYQRGLTQGRAGADVLRLPGTDAADDAAMGGDSGANSGTRGA